MHRIITLAAAASLLALAACNRDTETVPAADDAAASADAMSADSAGSDASTGAPARPSSTATSTATSISAASETMAPADSSMASPTGVDVGPVTDETRARAQTAAEETNLHPKPPTN